MDHNNRNYTAQRFNDLCDQIESEGYDITKGTVLIDLRGVIADGAHRLACAYHLYGPDFVVYAKYSDFVQRVTESVPVVSSSNGDQDL